MEVYKIVLIIEKIKALHGFLLHYIIKLSRKRKRKKSIQKKIF